MMLAMGAFMGTTFGTLAYTGNRLSGWQRENEDEFDAKMQMKFPARSNLDDNIALVGEGRG